MSDFYRNNLLIDFYGELLTQKQLEFMTKYYYEDFSLTEIAETFGITKQGVNDLIKRTLTTLEKYEQKLGLLDKHNAKKETCEQLTQIIKQLKEIDENTKDDIINLIELLMT